MEDNPILVEALVGMRPRGVRIIAGNLQAPATVGVV
jgi:hypothetical protein